MANKIMARLHPTAKKSTRFKASTSHDNVAANIVDIDDDDDFVSPPVRKATTRSVQKNVVSSATSSDDLMTQFGKYPPAQAAKPADPLVLSNKCRSKTSKKLMKEVPPFKPYIFPYPIEAKQFKDLILSKEYLQEHGKSVLVMFTNTHDDPVTIDGNLMFKLFGCCQEMESEIMDYIISYWKDDPVAKKMFESGERVLLNPFTIPYLLDHAPFLPKDKDGNELPRPPYDVKQAVRHFIGYVREDENLLLDANLILIPRFHRGHHTLYVMNRYTESVKIFDSTRYADLDITRTEHHYDRVEIIKRMVAVMKEFYGESAFNKKDQIPWDVKADRCNFPFTPEQGPNECGFYMLKMARIYDGLKVLEKLRKKDRRVEEWKAEFMFQLLYHQKNELTPADWPPPLMDVACN